MFLKPVGALKNVLKTVKHTIESLYKKAFEYTSRVVRYFGSCLLAFGCSVKGYARLVVSLFSEIKSSGIKTALSSHISKIKAACRNHTPMLSKSAAIAIPLAFMVLVGVSAPVWANFTFAKRVLYAKTAIGEVLDAKVCKSAEAYFIEAIAGDDGKDYLEDYSLKTVYVMKKRVLSAESLAVQMLNNTESLVGGFGLYIDGKLALVSERSEAFYSNLDYLLLKNKNNETAEVSFIQQVEVRDGYFPATDCVDSSAVDAAFADNTIKLSVKTTLIEEYDEEVAYTTKEIKSESLTAGKSKVVVKGKKGINHVTARVTYVDGVEVQRIVTGTQVVSKPVTRQVIVGTKKAATVKSSKVMLWPIPKSTYYRISSEFNNDRGDHYHKGVDIACDKGTPIYAVMSGTVTLVKSTGSYGKHIMIDHGNNIVTLYAHCSAMYVSVGDKVSKGEHIAAVGNTGRSTGDHLHIEVRINGKVYDPMKYLDK